LTVGLSSIVNHARVYRTLKNTWKSTE